MTERKIYAQVVGPFVQRWLEVNVYQDGKYGAAVAARYLGQEVSIAFAVDDIDELISRLKKARKSAVCARKSEESATKSHTPPPL